MKYQIYQNTLNSLKELFQNDENITEIQAAIDLLNNKLEAFSSEEKNNISKKEAPDFPLTHELLIENYHYQLFLDSYYKDKNGITYYMIQTPDGKILTEGHTLNENISTHNESELVGAIEILIILRKLLTNERKKIKDIKICFTSKSKNMMNMLNGDYNKLKEDRWREKDNHIIENADLWNQFDKLTIDFERVKYLFVRNKGQLKQADHCSESLKNLLG